MPEVDAAAAQAAVASAGSRVTALLRSATDPSSPAVGAWDLTDVAVHLSHTLDGITAMAEGGGSLLADLWQLPTLTATLLAGETERDLPAIADRIDASVAHFLAVVRAARPDERRAWLVKGTQLSIAELSCHALNDLLVHGHDIAAAVGAPWVISRSDARLALCGFLFPVLDRLGRAVVDQQAAAGVQASLDVRLRGGGRAFLRFQDGELSVQGSPPGTVDCHLSVDPTAFLLVAWGRWSQWPAVLRGQLLAWGRRPWLGPKLRPMLRNP